MSIRLITVIILSALIFSGCATAPYQPSITQPSGIYHIVGSGQTLYRIAQVYNVDINKIIRANGLANPNQIGVGDHLFIPGVAVPLRVESYRPLSLEPIEKLVGPKHYKVRWRYITLHHSATTEGNAEAFDRNHRRRGMGGLFYHFVIGNGTGSRDGELEVGWRWIRQSQVERKGDIQVCLVGDYNRQEISPAQFAALVKLLKVLTQQYAIPLNHIRKHQDAVSKYTECPGNKLPFYKILAELRK